LTELAFSAALEDDGTVAMPPSAAEISSPAMTALESEAAANEPVPIDRPVLVTAKIGTAAPPRRLLSCAFRCRKPIRADPISTCRVMRNT